MKQAIFTMPPMPEMEFAITRTKLDASSPMNVNEAHIHKTCEVYVNLSGKVSFAVEDRLYPISRGSVIVTMPYEYHHCIYHSDEPHEHFWITFSAQNDQEYLNLFFGREKGMDNRIVLEEPALEKLCELLEVLMDEKVQMLDRRIGILQFFRILSEGQRSTQFAPAQKLPQTVETALGYMDQNLAQELDIQMLARKCHVSVNTLERHFRESLGITPFAAIRRKRLFVSMMYLRKGESVTAAARKSGFSDYSNYIQLFRKQFGITPGQYKNQFFANK